MTHRERAHALLSAMGFRVVSDFQRHEGAVTAALEAVERETEARTWREAAWAVLDAPLRRAAKDTASALAIDFEARARAAGPQAQTALPRGEAPDLRAERHAEIRANIRRKRGMPSETPPGKCQTCEGTRWIQLGFEGIKPCPRCNWGGSPAPTGKP